MKNWKQSKTIWFNIFALILGITPMINSDVLTAFGVVNVPLYMTLLSLFTGIGNMLLRMITNKAIETK
jgi:hypothetical protein